MKDDQQQLREHLTALLRGGQSFRPMEEIVQGITLADAGRKPEKLPYTLWQLLEHLRIAQWDILEFSRNPEHQSPAWPDEYWPDAEAPANQQALNRTLDALADELEEMIQLVQDPKNDLYAPITHGDGQTLLREAQVLAQHNAYHLGEIIVVRRLLGEWT
ncbi:DinB family protein [Pontibacter chitinilyticus]|uniref:DinB family protein n=1 Tax=Pontibacter chitinilyticus TaxID=2674989 RepID=UPI00321A704E